MADIKVSQLKSATLRAQSPDELKALLLDLKKEQLNQRFTRATGQAENTSRVRLVRRAVARIKTLLTQDAHKGKVASVSDRLSRKEK